MTPEVAMLVAIGRAAASPAEDENENDKEEPRGFFVFLSPDAPSRGFPLEPTTRG